MLFINLDLNPNIKEICKSIEQSKSIEVVLLDFSNSLKNSIKVQGTTVAYPNDYDLNGEIHKQAISNYTQNISKIGDIQLTNGTKVRDILFGDFPVYWLTSVSLKHAQLSIQKNFYYLIELLRKTNLKSAFKRVTITLPNNEVYFESFFKNKISNEFKIEADILCYERKAPIYSTWSKRAFIKGIYNNYKSALKRRTKLIGKNQTSVPRNLIFTFPFSTWNANKKSDAVFGNLEKHINRNSNSAYVPMLLSIYDVSRTENWEENWDRRFLQCFPGYWSLFKFLYRTHKFINKIDQISFKSNSNEYVDEIILKRELSDLIYIDHGFLFYHAWLKKYFSTINQRASFFYQDEFYISGRIVSHAIKQVNNTKVEAYGVQHGLFFSGHTVYTITNTEINGKNAMPLPRKFIVWGNYFKEQFLSHNSLSKEYVIVAGNLKYDKKHQDTEDSKTKCKTILWCTTVSSDNIVMLDIIKERIKELKDYELLVRCHPQFRVEEHLKKLFQLSGIANYKFSTTESIFTDIQNSAVMISSSASTTFMDGLNGNRPVINIVLPDYVSDFGEIENLYNVHNQDEFNKVVNSLIETNFSFKTAGMADFNASTENWDKVIVTNNG